MKIVVIGSSTGGPRGLTTIVSELPKNLGAVVVIIQHISSQFTKSMSERLDGLSEMKVKEAEQGEELLENHVYIVPGDKHFLLTNSSEGKQVFLLGLKESNSPSIDIGFTSIAEHFNKNVLGVILSGMGKDGLKGAEAIKNAGGKVIVQDEETSVVYGMPKVVSEARLADFELPIDQIPRKIVQLISN
jgi:two-component system chemotaxis response regulator CheB